MKKLTLIFTTLLIMICPTTTWSNNQGNSTSQTTRLNSNKGSLSIRPRTPSIEYIDCIYYSSQLEFILPAEIDNLYVTIYSGDELVLSDMVTSETNIIDVPSLTTGDIIICETINGEIFSGEIK